MYFNIIETTKYATFCFLPTVCCKFDFLNLKLRYIFREWTICTVWQTKPILMPAVRIGLFFLYCKS